MKPVVHVYILICTCVNMDWFVFFFFYNKVFQPAWKCEYHVANVLNVSSS